MRTADRLRAGLQTLQCVTCCLSQCVFFGHTGGNVPICTERGCRHPQQAKLEPDARGFKGVAVATCCGWDSRVPEAGGVNCAEFVKWRFFFAKWRGNLFGGM